MFYHDGKLQYPVKVHSPSPFFGGEPMLAAPVPEGFAETQQMSDGDASRMAKGAGGSMMEKLSDSLGL